MNMSFNLGFLLRRQHLSGGKVLTNDILEYWRAFDVKVTMYFHYVYYSDSLIECVLYPYNMLITSSIPVASLESESHDK